jgi:hypothetical protein
VLPLFVLIIKQIFLGLGVHVLASPSAKDELYFVKEIHVSMNAQNGSTNFDFSNDEIFIVFYFKISPYS